jgi:hypothetical protein
MADHRTGAEQHRARKPLLEPACPVTASLVEGSMPTNSKPRQSARCAGARSPAAGFGSVLLITHAHRHAHISVSVQPVHVGDEALWDELK